MSCTGAIARRFLGSAALPGGLAVAAAVLMGGCAAFGGPGLPRPPREHPVGTPVLVSADGRVITGVDAKVCGHDPLLVARSYPGKVTLRWVNPDTGCNGEVFPVDVARARLLAPLGGRALVQPGSGRPVPYFDERDLASAVALPAGYRLTSDLPSVNFPESDEWAVGDTRTYAGPPGSAARLTIAQLVTATGLINGIMPLTPWPWPARVRVRGRPAPLLVQRAGGLVFARTITWVEDGYRFVVDISVQGHRQVPLSSAQLVAVADGIRSRPRPQPTTRRIPYAADVQVAAASHQFRPGLPSPAGRRPELITSTIAGMLRRRGSSRRARLG